MSAPASTSPTALLRRRAAGVVFLAVLASLVWLSILLYQKAFTDVVNVSLKTDRIGNQLSAQADVKLRGIVVGRVTKVRSEGQGATVELALDPGRAKDIPQNVTAQLIPKTLFGEKYVELRLPATKEGELSEGDVIPQDRSETALETERVLNDLMPLLQELRPAQLSTTLNALSTALRDRGDRLGANFELAGAYLQRLNPSVPQIGEDFAGLADLSNNIASVTPQLLDVLDNFSASSRSLADQQDELHAFLTSTQGFASTAESIVAENEDRFIALARDSRLPLELFARYAPEFPCFFKGLATYDPIVTRTFGGAQPGLHITLEVTQDNGGYAPTDEPEYADKRGPECWGLPKPTVPEPDDQFDDGYRDEPGSQGKALRDPALALVAGSALGVSPAAVPDAVSLLLGPIAGGNAVGLA